MMRSIIMLLAVAAMLAAASPASAADSDAVKAKMATCFACHGEGGVSKMTGVPSLAAQPSYFAQWQLVFFRNGSRKNPIMQPMAAGLSNDDIRNIGAYLQALPPPKPPAGPDDHPELTKAGAKLAVEHRCNTCHTANFAGQQATARLAGQREEVLLKALHDYKAGTRTGTGVAAMPEIAFSLTEDEMKALSHYLARLP